MLGGSVWRWVICIGLLILAVLAIKVMLLDLSFAPNKRNGNVAAVLPEFTLVDGMTGHELTREDVVGEKLLFNVWATWCVACKEEHEFLQTLANDGVKIVGLFYRDAPESADNWLAEKGNPYVVNLVDMRGQLADSLPVVGAPETYFIDRRGTIVYKHLGVLDENNWKDTFAAIYAKMD